MNVEELHALYCERTGLEIRLAYDRERYWFDFIKAGFTKDDLNLVVGSLLKGIGKGDRNPGCLRFRNLIQQLDNFDEELAQARAQMRNFKVQSPKEKAMESLRGPSNVVPMNARPAKEVIEKLAQDLRKAAE